MVKDLESKISYLEYLLQNISSSILANVFYEKAPPSRLLADSESYVDLVKKTADEMKDLMLLLKPERAPSIKRAIREFIQPINSYIETLKNPPEQTPKITKQSLEYLRSAMAQSQELINLARDIARNPSSGIVEILRLKEISETKEYLSRVSVPEVIYVRLEHLKKSLSDLKASISSFERSAQELLKCVSRLEEEISRFQQA